MMSRVVLLLLFLLPGLSSCVSQEPRAIRQPAVAGQFYPGGRAELRQTVEALFRQAASPAGTSVVRALIVPHAGYVFSGGVAASGINQIDPGREFENIFLIGASHHAAFGGAAIDRGHDFATPLGVVPVNVEVADELIKDHRVFVDRADVHAPDHSLEVELPLLQVHMRKNFRIVPILLGTSDSRVCGEIGEALRPYFTPANLFIISSDFSHYPPAGDAARLDSETAGAIVRNSPDALLRVLQAHEQRADLATSLCGWPAVLALLSITEGDSGISYREVQYRNSGDVQGAGKEKVVGYWAIAVERGKPERASFGLTSPERKELLGIARQTVERYVRDRAVPPVDASSLPAALTTPCGAFVTLTKHRELRGCIGRFDASEPLYAVVQGMAVAAATQDYRFRPVEPSELRDISVEISVLTPMRRIASAEEFEPGRHGIYIRKGSRSGTFLPQVGAETGWSREELLGHCAQDKAGIGWDGWKDAELYVYEAIVFGEE